MSTTTVNATTVTAGHAPRFSLAENDEISAMPAVTLYRGLASAGGVNIFA